MKGQEKRLPAAFDRTDTGAEPVREWLKTLPRADRLLIGEDIKDVEFSWPIGMPLCRNVGQGLWEVRTNLKDRIARVLLCVYEEQMVLLHGFIKKTARTPAPDLELARKRKRDLEEAKDEKESPYRLKL
jgi:phage-related protein